MQVGSRIGVFCGNIRGTDASPVYCAGAALSSSAGLQYSLTLRFPDAGLRLEDVC